MGYRGKLEEREQARELRAQAWTLAEIAAEIGVSKSSASLWCRDVDESALANRRRERWLDGNHSARMRGPNVLQRRKHEQIERLRAEGRDRIGRLAEREFLLAGLMLYAGEGTKRDGSVRSTSGPTSRTSRVHSSARHTARSLTRRSDPRSIHVAA